MCSQSVVNIDVRCSGAGVDSSEQRSTLHKSSCLVPTMISSIGILWILWDCLKRFVTRSRISRVGQVEPRGNLAMPRCPIQ